MSSAAPKYDQQNPRDRARLRVLDAALGPIDVEVGHQTAARAMAEAIARVDAARPDHSSKVLEIANQEIDRIVWLDTCVEARLELGRQMARIVGRAFQLALWVNALELVGDPTRDERAFDVDDARYDRLAERTRVLELAVRYGEPMPRRMPSGRSGGQ